MKITLTSICVWQCDPSFVYLHLSRLNSTSFLDINTLKKGLKQVASVGIEPRPQLAISIKEYDIYKFIYLAV